MGFAEKNLFFIDAETDGLYGSIISVGIIVTDSKCREIERHYYGIDPVALQVTDPWVREHVIPILGDYEKCPDEEALLHRVWDCWIKYADDAYAVGDVIYPVEAGVFKKCVSLDPEKNKFKGPFPLLDLSSLLFARGINPLVERESLLESNKKGEQHNALYDIETTVQIFKKYILGGEEWTQN